MCTYYIDYSDFQQTLYSQLAKMKPSLSQKKKTNRQTSQTDDKIMAIANLCVAVQSAKY